MLCPLQPTPLDSSGQVSLARARSATPKIGLGKSLDKALCCCTSKANGTSSLCRIALTSALMQPSCDKCHTCYRALGTPCHSTTGITSKYHQHTARTGARCLHGALQHELQDSLPICLWMTTTSTRAPRVRLSSAPSRPSPKAVKAPRALQGPHPEECSRWRRPSKALGQPKSASGSGQWKLNGKISPRRPDINEV